MDGLPHFLVHNLFHPLPDIRSLHILRFQDFIIVGEQVYIQANPLRRLVFGTASYFKLNLFQGPYHLLFFNSGSEHGHLIGEQCRIPQMQRLCFHLRCKTNGWKQSLQFTACQREILLPLVITSDADKTSTQSPD